MKKIISGMLICTVLLNSFSLIASGEELVKTETTGEAGLVTQATSETTTNSTEDISSVTEENTSERESSASSTKEEPRDSSTNSTTEEHSSVSETNTTDSKTEASQSSEVEKKTIDQDDADYQEAAREGTNHKKGTYAMKNGISSRVARATVANVYANDPNLPGKNFIDVSSWNGDISVAEYQKIKRYGVTGVSVKLTEGTWYVNPYAAGQIRNAKAAGLKVSAYHYSMYVSAATAQDEARYFAQAAANSGLDKNTIMFNDAEDPTLTNNGRNAHANSVAFNQQLKALGYKNDALYVGKWWLTAGYIDTSAFGRDRVWVAQYPYTPDSSMQWNNDHGAWQWSSQMYFPGLANYEGRPFDISMTYSNFLNMGNSSGPDLSKYYTTNPNKVVALNNGNYYTDTSFSVKKSSYKKGDIMTVLGIEYSNNGYPRLLTSLGYVNAIKTNVLQVTTTIDNYITDNVSKVLFLQNGNYYIDPNFTNVVGSYQAGEIVDILGIEYSTSGYPRLKTNKGYINGIKSNVAPLVPNYNDYYYLNPQKVVANIELNGYTDVNFSQVKSTLKKGELLDVIGIAYTDKGYPRLITNQGYINASKAYVQKVIPNIDDYITDIDTQFVYTLKEGSYYNNLDFDKKVGYFKKGEVIPVKSIEFTNKGYPRLKTDFGYVNPQRTNLSKLVPNYTSYFYENPELLASLKDFNYYQDIDLNIKKGTYNKGELINVQKVEFTRNGYPRLVTDKGYINGIKSNSVKVTSTIKNYITKDVQKVLFKSTGNYFNNVAFSQVIGSYTKDDVVDVKGIEYTTNGYPRLLTSKGYVNAIKDNVQKVIPNIENYYYKDVNYVVALKNTNFYTDVEFSEPVQILPKNKLIKVESIEFTEKGYPRLKNEQGYLNAVKTNVVKVINNLNDYYYEDVRTVEALHEGVFFDDVDFTKKRGNYKKGDKLIVNKIEYSQTGYPRILTNMGYINSIKTNVKKIN